jgi:hypothetical protein
MRIGKISAIAAAVAVAAFASSASAQVFSLSPSPTVSGGTATFSGGSVTLQQTTTINCAVSAVLNVAGSPGSGSGSLSSPTISAGNPFCGILVFPVTPWSAATISGQTIPSAPGSANVNVTVGANTIANDPCDPQAVVATLATTSSGSTLTFNNVKLQARSGRADRVCTINGVLSSSTSVYIF